VPVSVTNSHPARRLLDFTIEHEHWPNRPTMIIPSYLGRCGPYFSLAAMSHFFSNTGNEVTPGRCQSYCSAALAPLGWAGSRVARLLAMAARCAAAPAPLAGSQPSGAGSTAQVAEPLAMAARYAGRGSDSALCNLRRAADRARSSRGPVEIWPDPGIRRPPARGGHARGPRRAFP
jgi:hypothetical protein